MQATGNLSVTGAKFDARLGSMIDDLSINNRPLSTAMNNPPSNALQTNAFEGKTLSSVGGSPNLSKASSLRSSFVGEYSDKYWAKSHPPAGMQDVVVIHVCDESRHTSKDFCCKRDILVKHMKYFDRFLTENDSGYDDIDISVHCDIDIFEWLMAYIHEPDKPPNMDKSIVVSILISSEFLQMDSLVELCLEHICSNLNDIVKLPIDLSCISEKLVNKLALMTHPKILANTKDRKDKILNKLYKRRVELDFSRKSSGRSGARTIAASLTCCRFCGCVYLETYSQQLICRKAPSAVDFRGRINRQHFPITAWSLTAYLKALHAGNMGWESIYWHVWGACVVLQAGDIVINALEVDRYTVESDGLVLRLGYSEDSVTGDFDGDNAGGIFNKNDGKPPLPTSNPTPKLPPKPQTFTLDNNTIHSLETARMVVNASFSIDLTGNSHITPSLSVQRPANILTQEILQLLQLQLRLISGAGHRKLIDMTAKAMVANARKTDLMEPFDFQEALWGESDRNGTGGDDADTPRGRSRSPGVFGEHRKQTHSLSKGRTTVTSGGEEERRSRSSSTGANRALTGRSASLIAASDNAKAAARLSQGASSSSGGVAAKTSVIELDEQSDDEGEKANMFHNMPADVALAWLRTRGTYQGISLTPLPLELNPSAYLDTMSMIQETSLGPAKKLEWLLDVQREFDEKRIEKFETFLVSRRELQPDTTSGVSAGGPPPQSPRPNIKTLRFNYNARRRMEETEVGSKTSIIAIPVVPLPKFIGEYYKDRGRQPRGPSAGV